MLKKSKLQIFDRKSIIPIGIIEFRSVLSCVVLCFNSIVDWIYALLRKNLYRLEFSVTCKDLWQFSVLGFQCPINSRHFREKREERKDERKRKETQKHKNPFCFHFSLHIIFLPIKSSFSCICSWNFQKHQSFYFFF